MGMEMFLLQEELHLMSLLAVGDSDACGELIGCTDSDAAKL